MGKIRSSAASVVRGLQLRMKLQIYLTSPVEYDTEDYVSGQLRISNEVKTDMFCFTVALRMAAEKKSLFQIID